MAFKKKAQTNISLGSHKSDLFGISDSELESVQELPIDDLVAFDIPEKNIHHPFHVNDDADMDELVDSIKNNGVLIPIIVRNSNDKKYEIISGHRRCHAAKKLGLKSIPAIVKDMDDDTATVVMVDSNFQREHLLPSERAFGYKYRLEALKNLGKSEGFTQSRDEIGSNNGETGRTVSNYVRLTNLIPELLSLVDIGSITLVAALQLSNLKKDYQKKVYRCLETVANYPNEKQAKLIREAEGTSKGEEFTLQVMQILNGAAKQPKRSFKMNSKKINEYFDDSFTEEEIENKIYELLDAWRDSQLH